MFPIQKYTKRLFLFLLWAYNVTGKEFYCPDIPDWNKKPAEERVDYTKYDLIKEGVFVASEKQILFETKGKHDAHILLQNEPDEYFGNVYEIVLGSRNNEMSVMRTSLYGPNFVSRETYGILNETEYRSFWIKWNTTLAIGQGTRIDINNIILFTHLDFTINSMRISYGWGSDGFFRFYENSVVVTSPQTATSTKKETSDSRSTQNRITDALLPESGPILSRQDEDKPSFIMVVLATSTGCLGLVLLSTLIGFCCLWNKKIATEMGTHSQPNPGRGGRGEHFEGREHYCICQNEEHYATVSF